MNGQGEMFETPDPLLPHQRPAPEPYPETLYDGRPPAEDTTTSRAAASSVTVAAQSMRAALLRRLRASGLSGMTDEEMQHALGMNPNTQRPRRRELVLLGAITDSGRTRPCRSGRAASVWILKEDLA